MSANEQLSIVELSNLRVLVSLSNAALLTGSKSDQQWQTIRVDLYRKLGQIRDKMEGC